MRGYGIPQVCFAIESFMDDVANEIHMDPLEFRRKNLIQGYYEDAYLKPIAANTNGIFECLEKGAEYIHWDEKRNIIAVITTTATVCFTSVCCSGQTIFLNSA